MAEEQQVSGEKEVGPTAKVVPAHLTFSKEEFDNQMESFNGNVPQFAANMSAVLQEQYQDPKFLTYQGLKDGTAPVFDLFPSFKNTAPQNRRLTDEQIVSLFAFDTEGNPIQAGTFLEGFTRELPAQAAAVPGFMGGFSFGQSLVAGIPPVTVPTAALRIGVPLITGTIGSMATYALGEEVTEAIAGEEKPMLPGTAAAYEAGKTTAGALAWMPMPFMIPQKLNFGVQAVESMWRYKGKNILTSGKGTNLGLRFARGLENTVGSLGKTAKAAPSAFLKAEVAAGAGAALGAYGAETYKPGDTTTRLVGEFAGGLSVPVIKSVIFDRIPMMKSALTNMISYGKEGKAQNAAMELAGKGTKEMRRQNINYILDLLEDSGEDADAVIQALASKEFEGILLDPDTGAPIELTAGLKAGSPTILALEKALDRLSTGLGKERGSANVQATRALRNYVMAMYASGDKEALRNGAELAAQIFEADLTSGIQKAVDETFKAFNRVKGGESPERQAVLGRNLIQVFEQRFKLGRDNERRLWQQTNRNGEITTFRDPSGREIDEPNFMAYWKSTLPTTKQAAAPIKRALGDLAEFYDVKLRELFPEEADAVAEAASTGPSQTQRSFDTAFLKIRGTESEDVYNTIMSSLEGLDPEAAMTRLGQEANSRRRGGPRSTQIANALDRQRELMATQVAPDAPAIQRITAAALERAQTNFDAAEQSFLSGGGDARDLQYYTRRIDSGLNDTPRMDQVGDQVTADVAQLRNDGQGALADAVASYFQSRDLTVQARTQPSAARGSAMSGARAVTPDAPDAEEPGTLSVIELVEMRSTAINLGRQLAAAGDSNSARIAYGFADALLEDLESFPEGVDPAYDTARSYSRAFNDAFTRTFVGEAMGDVKTGAPKVAPEMLANDLFNADAGYLRSLQIDGIGKFEITQAMTNLAGESAGELRPLLDDMLETSINPDNQMLDQRALSQWIFENAGALAEYPDVLNRVREAANLTTTTRGTVESILRNIRSTANMFNPDTGEVNPDSLRKWMAKNENVDVLNAMPALKADLENSASANLLLKEGSEAMKDRRAEVKKQSSFMDLLPSTTENPTTAFTQALARNNKNPIMKGLNPLWKVVQDAPESWTTPDGTTHTRADAIEGFRSSLLESVFTKNGQTSLTFSPRAAFDDLFSPVPNSQNKISVSEWMLENGVMPQADIDRMRKFMAEMVKMEAFAATGDINLQDVAENVGPAMDFYLRIQGSNLGAGASEMIGGGGNDLIARGAGSKLFRNAYNKVFSAIPEELKMDSMQAIMKDPELLATLLKKGRTDREQLNIAGRLSTLLIEKGLIPAGQIATGFFRRQAPAVVRESTESVVDKEPTKYGTESLNLPIPEEQSSLQPLPRRDLPPSTQTAAPSGVQTASVDPAGSAAQRPQSIAASGGISKIDPQRARAFFDSPGEITFAARGGEIRSGIGGLFR